MASDDCKRDTLAPHDLGKIREVQGIARWDKRNSMFALLREVGAIANSNGFVTVHCTTKEFAGSHKLFGGPREPLTVGFSSRVMCNTEEILPFVDDISKPP